MQKLLQNKWTIAFFVLPALVVYVFVVPLPVFESIYDSFFNWDLISPMKFVALKNYIELFVSDPFFYLILKNTVIFTIVCIVLQLPLAMLLAYWLQDRKLFASKFFRNVFFLPTVLSGTAIGILWQFLYQPQIGLINVVIRMLGFTHFSKAWLADPTFAIYAVAFCVSWQFFGYHMVIYLAGMSTVPHEVIESARMDGANGWNTFRFVTFPMMRPFVQISVVLITTSSLKVFDNVLALTGGGPGNDSSVLSLYMYKNAFLYSRYGYASAIATLLLILNVLLTLSISYAFREREVRRRRKVMVSNGAEPHLSSII